MEQTWELLDRKIIGFIYGLYFILAGLFVDFSAELLVEIFGVTSEKRSLTWTEVIEKIEVSERIYPNQGIYQSGWNGLRMLLFFGLPAGLLIGLLHIFSLGVNNWLEDGLFSGLFVGLLGSLFYGGQAVIQHYVLRWLLARALPYPFRDSRLVAFLDAMHARILLRRVGGGWSFVHRSLQDYFASLAESAAD